MPGVGGERLPDDDLFQAGGPNSVRGFGADSLGRRDAVNDVALGEAVIIINQELRYRTRRAASGARSSTTPATCSRACRTSTCDLAHSLGVGLRYDSAVGPPARRPRPSP